MAMLVAALLVVVGCGVANAGLRDGLLPDLGRPPCPDGSEPVNCLVDPCSTASCPAFPTAACMANYCGGCNAHFFMTTGTGERLEVMCEAEPSAASVTSAQPVPFVSERPVRPSLPPAAEQCPDGCRGQKGGKGEPGWYGARGSRGLPGATGKHGNYLIYTDGYILPSGTQVSTAHAKQAAGGKVSTASEFGPEAMGDKGDQGPPGRNGLPGNPGYPGAMGRPGDPGPVGDKGAVGELGVKGVMGQRGWDGISGLRGDRGPDGPFGDFGPMGRSGDAGQVGDAGARGVPGDPGDNGNDGTNGEKGVQGIGGIPGIPGIDGARGDRGPVGNPGPQGAEGAEGAVGADGNKGMLGADGQGGDVGLSGTAGAQGGRGDYGPDVKEVSIQIAMACTSSNNGKVQYDRTSNKLYFCNGREWRCVDHVDCNFNCRVSEWGPWDPCSHTCGAGIQYRHRTVMAPAGPYGNPCPLLSRSQVCPGTPCSCRSPANIANGRLNSTQATYGIGEVASWMCNNGFEFAASGTALCREGGRFTSLPVCQPVQCPDPGIPANGERRDGAVALFYRGRVTYSCKEGYALSGTRSLQCQANRQWSARTPTCDPVDCADPGAPANGARDLDATTYRSSVSYSCNAGYRLTGAAAAICQANGRWSEPRPSCMPVSCSNPGTPEHGSMSASGSNFGYGTTATFTCDEGYALIGSAVRLCLESGDWSGIQPVCNARACPRVAAPENGEITTFTVKYTIGSRISFACNQGFAMQGDRSILCQDSGAWTAPVPVCARLSCCHLSEPANGQLVLTGRRYGDRAMYSCQPGFQLEGSAERTCRTSGTGAEWTGRPGRCVPIQCPDPEAPRDGQRQPAFSLFYAGDSVAYTCSMGFNLVGPSSRRCQADGTWDRPLPQCIEILCADPGTPRNGRRSGDSLRAFSSLTFSCIDNYRLNGDEVRTCQEDGNYSGRQPTCDPDCVVGDWGQWGLCSVTCGDGTSLRSRSIVQFDEGTGAICPALTDTRPCNPRSCTLCYGRYTTNQSAHITPSESAFAADVLVVVEQTEPMESAIDDLREFLIGVEAELLKKDTGTGNLLNRYTVVGFGRPANTGELCGHFILPASATDGETAFVASEAVAGLEIAVAAAPPTEITDGYEAMKFAIENANLRHMPNIAHNLIFLSGSSRTTGCGTSTVSKEQLVMSLAKNGVNPNFIIDHRIRAGNDKPEEVIGVKSFMNGGDSKLAYLRGRSGGYRSLPVDANTELDLSRVVGSISDDYTDIAFSLGGVMWNLNNFINQHEQSSQRGNFVAAFTEVKSSEMRQDARSCKYCTCEDDGATGLFRCQRQPDQNLCECRANGGLPEDCLTVST